MNKSHKMGFTLAEADCEQRLKLAGSGRDPKQASVTPFNASNQEKRNRAEANKNICGGVYGKNVFC
ncbi:MAG: hypothetical protein PHV68_09225, partial [Candidatus Gastranaerophilales bacterium]|nr:hypothetical protein [Candidatus Gastranaerophilales bacterium]